MGRSSRLKRERQRVRARAELVLAGARRTAVERFDRVMGRKADLMITTPADQAKMSDTLLEFAEPLVELARADESAQTLENALGVAIAIWNAPLLDV